MKTVTFCRHGEAEANAQGLLAGSKTDSRLTNVGRGQAREQAASLHGRVFDLIVSSPLSRATDTAGEIAQELGYQSEDIMIEALFTERDFGSATNRPKAEAFAMLDNGTAEDVETVEDFADRARRAWQWLRNRPEQHILVISHAALGQMMGTIFEGRDPHDFLSYRNLGNAEHYEFTLD